MNTILSIITNSVQYWKKVVVQELLYDIWKMITKDSQLESTENKIQLYQFDFSKYNILYMIYDSFIIFINFTTFSLLAV